MVSLMGKRIPFCWILRSAFRDAERLLYAFSNKISGIPESVIHPA